MPDPDTDPAADRRTFVSSQDTAHSNFKLQLEQCDQIWRNFVALAKKFKVFVNSLEGVYCIRQNIEYTLANIFAIGHIFINLNGIS